MNLWDKLFTTQISEPPQFELHWYIGLLCLLGSYFHALSFSRQSSLPAFYSDPSVCLTDCLYSWYCSNLMPPSESLPFYHSRIAMFVMLWIPGTSKYKQYFGPFRNFFGATAALAYLSFDPYPFPHVTILSFIIGHVAL